MAENIENATNDPTQVDPNDPNNQVKQFDLKEHKWLINGKWYFLLTKMPPRRYTEYLKLLPEVFFNTTFAGMYDTLVTIWELATSGNDVIGALHTIAERSYNQINSIVDFDKKDTAKLFELCALLLVREGEDVVKYDENVSRDKIEDFLNCEYDTLSFFFLLMHSVPHFTEIYNRLSMTSREKVKEAMS